MRYLLFLMLILTLVGCGGAEAEPASFTTYEAASAWYQKNSITDSMSPDSTAIAHAAYCANSQRKVLLIAFTSNPSKRYVFEGVPSPVWESFKQADSKGGYYNKNIKGRYRFLLGK